MKFKNISIYALTMAAGMGLWSCTSDEALSGGEAYGEPIPVTITLSRGDAQTRTELSENAEGGLDDKWLQNDQLVVINSNNEEVGVLKFVKYVDDSKPNEAVFQGTLEGVADGVYDYTLWYLGGNGTQQTPLSEFINDRTVDGSKPMLVKTTLTRQTGKLDDLVRGDLLSKQIKIRVSDHKAAVEQSLDAASRTMTAHLAMASIKLEGVGGVTDGTLKISHAPSNIDPVYKVYFNRYSTSKEASVGAKENPLIIDRVNTSDPVYMVLCPSQYSGNTALVLTLTSGDKTWTATLPDITMEAGKYYRNGADGNQFSVTMTESNKEVKLVYHANFIGATTETYEETQTANNGEVKFTVRNYQQLIDDNRLPTRKDYISFGWSKTPNGEIENLSEITADGSESTIDLYAVWTDQSKNPLRKWAKTNLIYSNGSSDFASTTWTRPSLYQFGRNIGWSDYIEASKSYGHWTEYSNGSPFSAFPYNPNLGNGVAFYNSSSFERIKNRFLLNSSYSGSSNDDDYWPIDERKNDDWKTRAEKCGYSTLCPTKWDLPTKDDFVEIMPTNMSLSNLINGCSEIKQIGDIRVAFVWRLMYQTNNIPGLFVRAAVVDKSVSNIPSDPNDAFWDVDGIKTRVFGATGYIGSFVETFYIHQQISYPSNYEVASVNYVYGWKCLGSQIIATPMCDGESESDPIRTSDGLRAYIHSIIDAWTDGGHYWTKDGYAIEWLLQDYGESPYFRIGKNPKHDALAVRCVLKEEYRKMSDPNYAE